MARARGTVKSAANIQSKPPPSRSKISAGSALSQRKAVQKTTSTREATAKPTKKRGTAPMSPLQKAINTENAAHARVVRKYSGVGQPDAFKDS